MVNIAAYFVPIEKGFEAFDYVRAQVQARHRSDDNRCFRFNQPVEYRFVHIGNDSLLQPVPPGRYVVSEVLGFTSGAPGEDSWQRAYAEIECDWMSRLGAKPHLMKLHSFAPDATGRMQPMQTCSACRLLSEDQKAMFEASRKQYDPHGLFASGFAHNVLLKPCPESCPTSHHCSPKGQPDCGTMAAVV